MIDISGHGLGHLNQVAPLVERLGRHWPACPITLRTALTEEVVRESIGVAFDRAPPPAEATMVMHDAIAVDAAASRAAYLDLHDDWDGVVAREADALAALAPDLLIADVPYSSLAAAARLGVPAVGYCSLNWHDVLAAYVDPDRDPAMDRVLGQIAEAYCAASLFARVEPALPMAWLARARPVGPSVLAGVNRRAAVLDRPGLPPVRRLVGFSFGGMPPGRPFRPPHLPETAWILPGHQVAGVGELEGRRDIIAWSPGRDGPFRDAIASSDAVVTKLGYATIVQAVLAGTALVYPPRPDWPEWPALDGWARRYGRVAWRETEALLDGDVALALEAALARDVAEPVIPAAEGARDALAAIETLLAGRAV